MRVLGLNGLIKKECEIIMATVTENKRRRGRPTLYEKYYKHPEFIKENYEFGFSERSESRRALNNEFYAMEATLLLSSADEEKYHKNFVTERGNIKNICILVEIGRLYTQAGYSAEFCINTAWKAIEQLGKGATVHETALRIRKYRLAQNYAVQRNQNLAVLT